MTKKTAVLILMIISISAGLFVLYLIFFPSKSPVNQLTEDGQIRRGDNFFPRAENNNNNQQPTNNVDVKIDPKSSRLRLISANSIAGFTLSDKTSTSTDGERITETTYKYLEKANGNVFETTSSSLDVNRITNTTIPKIQEAIFFNSGKNVLLRYLNQDKEIETFVGKIIEKTEAEKNSNSSDESNLAEIKGVFLTKNIDHVSKKIGTDLFFYIKEGKGYTFDGKNPQDQKAIMDQSITELISEWNDKGIILTTKSSGLYEGFVFSLPPNGGVMNKIVSGSRGITSKSNKAGSKIFYSSTSGAGVSNNIFTTSNASTTPLRSQTFGEKCVWSEKNQNTIYCAQPKSIPNIVLPDGWYRGLVSTDDEIIKMNVETGEVEIVASFPLSLDIIDMQLSENENYLVFVNKSDRTLWSLYIGKM